MACRHQAASDRLGARCNNMPSQPVLVPPSQLNHPQPSRPSHRHLNQLNQFKHLNQPAGAIVAWRACGSEDLEGSERAVVDSTPAANTPTLFHQRPAYIFAQMCDSTAHCGFVDAREHVACPRTHTEEHTQHRHMSRSAHTASLSPTNTTTPALSAT
eukprot:2316776-Rhodomonas_salina.1